MDSFTREALVGEGFCGFVPLMNLDHTAVPSQGGVYAVIRATESQPEFLETSCGGHFKGMDPTVDPSVLTSKWVDSSAVVYFGKANDIQRRLRQYRDFGRGRPVGHWGGRYIWQLADAADLLVCWQPTIDSPERVETTLLADFRKQHGKLPFANIAG